MTPAADETAKAVKPYFLKIALMLSLSGRCSCSLSLSLSRFSISLSSALSAVRRAASLSAISAVGISPSVHSEYFFVSCYFFFIFFMFCYSLSFSSIITSAGRPRLFFYSLGKFGLICSSTVVLFLANKKYRFYHSQPLILVV